MMVACMCCVPSHRRLALLTMFVGLVDQTENSTVVALSVLSALAPATWEVDVRASIVLHAINACLHHTVSVPCPVAQLRVCVCLSALPDPSRWVC